MTENNPRNQLFQHLDKVLKLAQKKYDIENGQSDIRKLKWGRLIIQAVQAYGKLLETDELESMKEDIELIKKELKLK